MDQPEETEQQSNAAKNVDREMSEDYWRTQAAPPASNSPSPQPRPMSQQTQHKAYSIPRAAEAPRTAPPTPRPRSQAGPVGQSVLVMSTLTRSPKYSFRGANDRFKSRAQMAAAQVPGPGAYSASEAASEFASRHRRPPGMAFGTARREANSRKAVPGPGAYSGASQGFIGKGKSCSLTPRRPEFSDMACYPVSPGPGSHDMPDLIGKQGCSYSCTPRRVDIKADYVSSSMPGPGQYGAIDKAQGITKPKDPSWRFGTSKRTGLPVRQDDRPVPGMKGLSTASAWDSKLPGPGSYEPKSMVGEGPKFSLGARRPQSRPAPSPGPGDTGGPYTTFA
eukprot:gb/GFBE01021683.1/.p1 GENE.gb/GFBE01021683.1/~~gb/GFBE01021683.1/.p1  ORF type:complete len:335 (+),score=24.09 gb/GFBE01021683.1/:1-1005(+)